MIAHIEKGHTRVEWRKLVGRKFFDRKLKLTDSENIQQKLEAALPSPAEMTDAIGRLIVTYPR